ncbi:unnamed protein product, partial [Bubo scandiacus]
METVLLEHFPGGLESFSSPPYFDEEDLFPEPPPPGRAGRRGAAGAGRGLPQPAAAGLLLPRRRRPRGRLSLPGAGRHLPAVARLARLRLRVLRGGGRGAAVPRGAAAGAGLGQAAAAGALRGGAAAAPSGRQRAGAAADAVHQRRLRGAALAHPHPALREAALQGGHAAPGHRLHQLPQRAGAVRPAAAQRQQREPQPAQENHHLPPRHKISLPERPRLRTPPTGRSLAVVDRRKATQRTKHHPDSQSVDTRGPAEGEQQTLPQRHRERAPLRLRGV